MLRTAFACTMGLFVLGSTRAQSSQGVAGYVRNFATQYVAATNARDIARLRLFLYPKSLACFTPANKDYCDAMASHLGELILPNYKFSVMPVNEGNLKALESMGQRWTVKLGQELLRIDYQEGDDVGGYVVYLIQENGRWFYDFPCATDAAIKQYRDNAANEAALAHYKALASEIKEPLRAETPRLASGARNRHCVDRYHKSVGEDVKTSMYVINALKAEAR